jgi:hypothetical protein
LPIFKQFIIRRYALASPNSRFIIPNWYNQRVISVAKRHSRSRANVLHLCGCLAGFSSLAFAIVKRSGKFSGGRFKQKLPKTPACGRTQKNNTDD